MSLKIEDKNLAESMETQRKYVGVLSGKGGVGKTTLAASILALAYKDPDIYPIALDCDVDAPNLALLLPPENEEYVNKKKVFATLKAEFLENKCSQCKKCINEHFCEFRALRWNDEKNYPEIDYIACEGCGACKVLCPTHAFDIKPVKSGEIISYKTELGFELIYGQTRLGSTTSGKLVSDVKEAVKGLKTFDSSNLIIIDGPPGIGCPVIATFAGLDYVIFITEPTPSGLHDLERAISVAQQFNIPYGIIINKSDVINDFKDDFLNSIRNADHPIIGEIPVDFSIPKAMSFSEPVVDFAPSSKASESIKNIYNSLKKILWN
ncbi:MAG: P-loop NTPase [Promethearchaeia archaeon]